MTPASVVVARVSLAIGAVIPVVAIAISIDHSPVVQTTFEVIAERSDTGAATLAAATAATARSVVAVVPHGPASTGDVEVFNTVEDLCHDITEVGGLPNAHAVLDGLVALEGHVHLVFALTEASEFIVTRLIESDIIATVGLLLISIVVGEGHFNTFRTVGAVKQHVDRNLIVKVHVLIEAVRPDGLALTRQSKLVEVVGVAARIRARSRTRSVGVRHAPAELLTHVVAKQGSSARGLINLAEDTSAGVASPVELASVVVEATTLDISRAVASRTDNSDSAGGLVDSVEVTSAILDTVHLTIEVNCNHLHALDTHAADEGRRVGGKIPSVEASVVGTVHHIGGVVVSAVDEEHAKAAATNNATSQRIDLVPVVIIIGGIHIAISSEVATEDRDTTVQACASRRSIDVILDPARRVAAAISIASIGEVATGHARNSRHRIDVALLGLRSKTASHSIKLGGHFRSIHSDRSSPADGAFNLLAAVAAIDGTDTPLVHASREVSPFNVDIDGVRHPDGGQEDGVLCCVRTIVVAVRTIHSVVIEAAGFSKTLARLANGDVVDIQIEHVGAVEVTDSHITHTAVCAQVNGIFIPVTLGTTAALTLDRLAFRFANALSSHRPFLDHGEGARVGVGRRNSQTEVFSSVAGILGAGIESDEATQLHLRRNEVVVRIEDSAHVVALAQHEVARTTVTSLTSHDLAAHVPTVTVAVGVNARPALHGAVLEVVGHARDGGFGLTVEGDVVNIEAVVIAIHAAVLLVAPFEGVRTLSDVEGLFSPAALAGIAALLDTVDVEVTIVPAALAGDLAEEAHDTVGRDVDRHAHVARHAGNAGATALHAVGAFIRLVCGDGPRIGGINLPIEQAEVAGLEGLDDFAARQTAAPVHFHVRAVGIQAVRIVLGNHAADRVEVLVEDVVDRARGHVVSDANRVALDRLVDGLVAVAAGRTIVATGIHSAAVVALAVGREVVGVGHTELILTNHGHGGVGNTSGTVLLIDVAVHVAAARDLHGDSVRRSALAFVVDGGNIVGVAVHVVGQRTVGVGGVADVVHLGGADDHTVTIHVVETVGTVDNRSPVQNNLFVVEHGLINNRQVLRDVEVSGEAPDRAAHALRASVVVELDVPEVVGVVPQVADGVAVSHIGREAAILRIHDGLRMTGLRMVGATKDQAPTGGVLGHLPTQGHASGFEVVGIVGGLGVEGKAFGLDGRARHLFNVDVNPEVLFRFTTINSGLRHFLFNSSRSHKVVSARSQAQVLDDGTSADACHSGRFTAAITTRNVELKQGTSGRI